MTDFGYLTLTRGLTWELYGDLWAFTSTEFLEFMAKNGVKHLKTVPYHSVTNGLAEHAVQMLKTAMKKSASEGNIDTRLARFLFHYRTTPNSTTAVSPAELLMGRKLKTHLDKLCPNLASFVYGWQQSQAMNQEWANLLSQWSSIHQALPLWSSLVTWRSSNQP